MSGRRRGSCDPERSSGVELKKERVGLKLFKFFEFFGVKFLSSCIVGNLFLELQINSYCQSNHEVGLSRKIILFFTFSKTQEVEVEVNIKKFLFKKLNSI